MEYITSWARKEIEKNKAAWFEEGKKKGKIEGKIEGKKEVFIEVAIRLLKGGYSDRAVMEATTLSKAELQKTKQMFIH